jgi:hypothetical protein
MRTKVHITPDATGSHSVTLSKNWQKRPVPEHCFSTVYGKVRIDLRESMFRNIYSNLTE